MKLKDARTLGEAKITFYEVEGRTGFQFEMDTELFNKLPPSLRKRIIEFEWEAFK